MSLPCIMSCTYMIFAFPLPPPCQSKRILQSGPSPHTVMKYVRCRDIQVGYIKGVPILFCPSPDNCIGK